MEYIWSTLLEDIVASQSSVENFGPSRWNVSSESEFGPGSKGGSDSEVDSDDEGNLDSAKEPDIEEELDKEWETEWNEMLSKHNLEWKNEWQEPISKGTLPTGQDLQLSEALFQLSMIFWTLQCRTGNIAASMLVHFTAVRSIHRHSLAYKSAHNYTPDLSKLVWIGRLLFLEYALPIHPYKTLRFPWPARDTYPDQASWLNEIRVKYLLRGGFSPMNLFRYLPQHIRHKDQ
jgi:hypothetical protein